MRSYRSIIFTKHQENRMQPTTARKTETSQMQAARALRDDTHLTRHYKAIGIGAIASALAVLRRASEKRKSPAHELPPFLRGENAAA
jgi:hypothetical protein